ncbi:methyl-accepting chemotaxis protein [Rugamonas rubra]|uniref:Methyl-accepting chemotaxis protein n=1 Tax=Rugamonas rubra TaxID=758825 RepID=A0A1I4SKP4_9BURK|nr:methyl-accepting chemotaxis protein [Rugamonas rubra]SFM65078.1 methyl-accepting chemotaxis protein [Rugamonas rubra]
MNLRNLTIGQRLGLSFALILLMLALSAALSYVKLQQLDDDIVRTNQDRYPKIVLAHTIKDELNETARNMRNMLLMSAPEQLAAEAANMAESSAVVARSIISLDKAIVLPQGRAIMATIQVQRGDFIAQRGEFLRLVEASDKAAAQQLLLERVRPAQMKYFAALDQLIALQSALMEASGKESTAAAATTEALLIGLTLAALLVGAVLAVLATRSITRPLARAVAAAQRVAAGDLSGTIVVDSRDETGQLLQALQDMNVKLHGIVGQVRGGTETIASAAGQIAAGNLDLSVRTEQQAGALEETASSMEQLTATVRQNAGNARQANSLALAASEAARQGGEMVGQVVATMGAINQSSRKIADIIGVIDSIAFQTNILALNAAVEAARAGEQGRGFAVVATEVRNLAQRSAAAAKDIKSLIDTSSAQVDAGGSLVERAGSGMQAIAADIGRVTEVMAEILAATREQSAGIEQINEAITQMDQVTQQNAALVEEAAAATAAMRQQADELSETVGVFRLHAGEAAAPVAPAPLSSAAPRRRRAAGTPTLLALAA